MQKIIFGLSLDASSFHEKEGVYFFGQTEFLRWLEQQLGLAWPSKNYAWLRVAYFRKMIILYLEANPDTLWKASFDADSYGTTRAILEMRDELRLSNWNFQKTDGISPLLESLSKLESFLYDYLNNPKNDKKQFIFRNGFADRFLEVEANLVKEHLSAFELTLVEPVELLPTWWQRILKSIQDLAIKIYHNKLSVNEMSAATDLAKVSQLMASGSFDGTKIHLKGDNTLLICRVSREYTSMEMVAYGYRNRVGNQPFLVMPSDLKLPDLVFESDGFPVSGNTSVSDLRPSQQLIKLAQVFLWKPIDLNKIVEFLNLPYSPLHHHLSYRLASALTKRPGFGNDDWVYAIQSFMASERLEDEDKQAAMFEYRFWFERKSFSQKSKIPKSEVFSIYQHLAQWAKRRLSSKKSGAIYMSIYRLSLDMLDLLDAIDEERISMLDLEKLSQIVIQATPATFKDRQVGASNFAQNPGAIVFPFDEVIWFNFVSQGANYITPKWNRQEIAFLRKQGAVLTLPDSQNKLRKWTRTQPFVLAKKRLLLLVPEKVDGQDTDMHPTHYELEAMIENIDDITLDLVDGLDGLKDIMEIRPQEAVLPKSDFLDGHLVEIEPINIPDLVDYFSVTELDSLLYYPHNWVLRKQLLMYGSTISKVKDINMVKGNIAHKLFEQLLVSETQNADNESIVFWFGQAFMDLIHTEGLPFLEYGMEPDLAAYKKQLLKSILSFVHTLRDNGWKVVTAEETLSGKLGKMPIKGITDVVLEREGRYLIVDLKWGGKQFRKNMLKNKEDLQLMLYSFYFDDQAKWWDTCFYIIRDGIFITRDDNLFVSAELVNSKDSTIDVYNDMRERLIKTLDWRFEQFKRGQLELRSSATVQALDELYGDAIFDLLPPKTESYRFDNFGHLLGEVD